MEEKIPLLVRAGVPVIVSIASQDDPQEFIILAQKLDEIKEVAAIELNISCPNIKEKGKLIAQDPRETAALVKAVRKVTTKTLITKLSPNVTDITEIALAAESAGSDAVSLINTLIGMSIDVKTRRPRIASVVGGLSGPAIRPVALRMVWEVYQKIKIPIIGMGGIMDASSALEFFLAGASAISVGTANFINPGITIEILKGIETYLRQTKFTSIRDLTGSLKK